MGLSTNLGSRAKHAGSHLLSSKMVQFSPCWDNMAAEQFVQILVRDVFRLQEGPQFLMSDSGKVSNQQTIQHNGQYHGIPALSTPHC